MVVYILVLGILLITMGTAEFVMPLKVFELWRSWINHRLFYLHGVLLIITGLPLTCADTVYFKTPVFITGIFVVFTGPFILIHADKIKKLFTQAIEETSPSSIKKLIYTDAVIRLSVGFILVYGSGITLSI